VMKRESKCVRLFTAHRRVLRFYGGLVGKPAEQNLPFDLHHGRNFEFVAEFPGTHRRLSVNALKNEDAKNEEARFSPGFQSQPTCCSSFFLPA
jgi:hypothetical protein